MAQTNFTTYTQTCDRCGKTDTSNSPHGLKLTGLYVYANRPSEFQSDLCNHLQLLEMCDDCLNAALTAIGPKAVEAYRNHQESMRRYQSYSLERIKLENECGKRTLDRCRDLSD